MLLLFLGGLAQPAPDAREASATAVAYLRTPAGTDLGLAIPLLGFQVDRYANRIGTWSITIPVDGPLYNGVPVSQSIRTGWKVSIRQDFNNPYGAGSVYLVTYGVVERRDYQWQDGVPVLNLAGSFAESDLARAQIHTPEEFGSYGNDVSCQTIVNSVAQRSVIVPGQSTVKLAATFNEGSRYAALLAVGEMARWTLRERWDGDALEFVPIDGAPWSGITLINIDQAGPELVG